MRVLDIYSKKDLDILLYRNKSISKIMDDFFDKFPKEYRVNYDKNIETLEIFKVDESFDYTTSGEYYTIYNVLMFKNISSIPHELIHLSSYDMENEQFAFSKYGDNTLCEAALIEGMTEYLASIARDTKPKTYFFEVFAVAMLSTIDRIFEPFFIPSYDEFIKLFPNKKDIVSLMYSLDFYKMRLGTNIFNKKDIVNLRRSIYDTINTLIDIEVSLDKDLVDREMYAQKFMDLISSKDIKDTVEYFCKNYIDYSNEQIKKRILRRI